MYEKLLRKVYESIKNEKSERTYNVFRVLNITDREVMMCRILADLLNPQGQHGKGCEYLRLFLTEVLGRKDEAEICESAKVYREYVICDDRRIDIVIASDQVFIPIEVKINASDQKSQCYDYLMYARRRDPEARMVYLTVWGEKPSKSSISNYDGTVSLEKSDYSCISFIEHIFDWLSVLIERELDSSMKIMLQMYRDAIRDFSQEFTSELNETLTDLVMESEDNFRAMIALSNISGRAKAKLMYTLFSEMKAAMCEIVDQFHLSEEKENRWYRYEEKADLNYYRQKASTFPGINYVFRDVVLPDGVQLWMRIEVEYRLYFGICLFDPNGGEEKEYQIKGSDDKVLAALRRYIHIEQSVFDGWWVKWWYLPNGADDYEEDLTEVPEFKGMNDAAIQLADPGKRRILIQSSVLTIEKCLKKILDKSLFPVYTPKSSQSEL